MNKSKSLIYFLFATALCLCDVNSAMAGQKNNSGENNNATEQVCQMGDKEKEFARLLINHPDQTHKTLECNPVLQKFAESRAEDLATRGYFSHVTPENTGPNELLENLGYVLPDTYIHGRHNSIESIGGGIAEPDKCWRHY